jgi:MerR family transcriptional regulator, light-induced transcriptional regulator
MQDFQLNLLSEQRGRRVRLPLSDSLTISDLSRLTGVPSPTLRSWETRYEFPRPTRLSGGHRRYSRSDVDAVLAVVRHRQSGLSLGAAVRHVAAGPPTSGSVFAELRRRHPELSPQVLSRRTLIALSRAIEDECCARASQPVLFGSFQREKFLRASYDRWLELSRTAVSTVVFADFAEPAALSGTRPVEVGVPPHAPLNREWTVVCDAHDLPVCLAAVELPGQRFEVLWSVDPRVVRDAGLVCASLADQYRPDWRTAGAGPVDLDTDVADVSEELRRVSDLFNRMLGYLELSR